jgi:hypothetical protein
MNSRISNSMMNQCEKHSKPKLFLARCRWCLRAFALLMNQVTTHARIIMHLRDVLANQNYPTNSCEFCSWVGRNDFFVDCDTCGACICHHCDIIHPCCNSAAFAVHTTDEDIIDYLRDILDNLDYPTFQCCDCGDVYHIENNHTCVKENLQRKVIIINQ